MSQQNKPKQLVSFDFDGVMHQAVKIDQRTDANEIWTYGPDRYDTAVGLYTHPTIIAKIHQESRKYNLIIVTARKPYQGKVILQYLRKIGLSKLFQGIYFCPDGKAEKLKQLGVIRHYEDSPKHVKAITDAGIQVVQVYPLSSKIFEPE